MIRFWSVESDPAAQGRISGAKPVAVLDIGSNSVRLVVYERHTRALTVLYNEKSASTLGRGVAATGLLSESSIERALRAVQRFAMICQVLEVGEVYVLATSATREARNGPDFVKSVTAIMGCEVSVLTGPEEAHFGALGVVAGMPEFSGVVGDLGGGSLELAVVTDHKDLPGETHGLGAIRLQDDSDMSPEKAATIARERLEKSDILADSAEFDCFAAIGGTWRALAKLHHTRCNYPLHMVHNYTVSAAELLDLCDELVSTSKSPKKISGMEAVSGSRRDLLPYGAAVMSQVLRMGKFKTVIFSALGVREGYLYERLDPRERAVDPLLEATEEMSLLRSRAPAFADDLIVSGTAFLSAIGVAETDEDVRLRKAACYISDIGWRAHPDYRGEQSIDMIAFSGFVGIEHPERAFLAQVLAIRYMGLKQKSTSTALLDLAGPELTKRARLIGAYFRVAYPLAAAMPGILPRVTFRVNGKTLELSLPSDLGFLDGERLTSRLNQLAGEAGLKAGAVIPQ